MNDLERNDLDHGTNLVYIERAICFVQNDQPVEASQELLAFGEAERARIQEKIQLMLASNIERWPSPHQSRQRTLMAALIEAIGRHDPLRRRPGSEVAM